MSNKHEVVIKNDLASYMRLRDNGYVTKWCGNGLICMAKREPSIAKETPVKMRRIG